MTDDDDRAGRSAHGYLRENDVDEMDGRGRVRLRCSACGHRFGHRSRLYAFPGTGAALCQACVGLSRWRRVHRRLWPGCAVNHDAVRDHGAMLVSVAGYNYLQSTEVERQSS